ncbi:MAG: hypothetical protein AAB440_01470 [Patescibacteria group bacterium]
MSEEPKQQKGVDRRELLKRAVTGGAFGAIDGLMTVPGIVIGAQYRREIVDFLTDAQHNSNVYIERTREFIKAQYGIEVTFGPDHQRRDEYRMEGLSEDEARTALSGLLITLYKYPPDFFKKHQLPLIRIGKNLFLNKEDPMLPGATLFMPFAGFADRTPEEIVISLPETLESFSLYLHHEIHHILEFRHLTEKHEDEWQALQESCECGTYVGGDLEPRNLDTRLATVFARGYGAVDSYEDRATIAEALLSVRYHASLLDRIEIIEDERLRETLRQKVNLIKRFYEILSPEINPEFWNRLENVSRGRGDRDGIVVTGTRRPRVSGFLQYDDAYITNEFQEWYPDLTEYR